MVEIDTRDDIWAEQVFQLGIMQDSVGPDIGFSVCLFVFGIMTINHSKMTLQTKI